MTKTLDNSSLEKNLITDKTPISDQVPKRQRVGEIRALTGLRGIAAFDVVLGHYNIHNLYYLGLFVFHDAAVDIFFALSSFTLFLVYGTDSKINWKNFAVARFARVYPLYFLVTLSGVYLNAYGQIFQLNTPSGQDMVKHLLSQIFLTAQLPIPSIAGFYIVALWSVPVEAYCYIFMFPLLHWASPRVRSPSKLITLVVVAVFSVLILYVKHFNPVVNSVGIIPPDDKWAYWLPALRGFLMFIAGWAAFKVYKQEHYFTKAMGISTDALALSSLIIILSGEAFGMIRKESIIVLAPFLIVGLTSPASFTSKMLSCVPIHYLGTISFSIYLLHLPVYIEVLYHFPSLANNEALRVSVPVVTTLMVSSVSYFLIENPARTFIKWLFKTSPRQVRS